MQTNKMFHMEQYNEMVPENDFQLKAIEKRQPFLKIFLILVALIYLVSNLVTLVIIW